MMERTVTEPAGESDISLHQETIPPDAVGPHTFSVPPRHRNATQYRAIDIAGVHRLALMVTPEFRGKAIEEATLALARTLGLLQSQSIPMSVVQQTVFIRDPSDIPVFRDLFTSHYGDECPGSTYIVQPPCEGQSLAIEAWAIGGDKVNVTFQDTNVVSVDYDATRWSYFSGIAPPREVTGAYEQSEFCFAELDRRLRRIGASFADVPRVWLYQGNITETENGQERYRELNRARTDFFEAHTQAGEMKTASPSATDEPPRVIYPASTGIGTRGDGLVLSAMAMQTTRDDVRTVALENPGQTSAFDYAKRFSLKSPKFSRAMAVLTGDHTTIWVSGTASILQSESVHLGDIEKQTHQTIDNMECLIDEKNLSRHGFKGCGATLNQLAKVRVYVKRAEDYEACRRVCESRFGDLPMIYAQADVCRPELLVEIEGVAFAEVQREGMIP